MARLLVIDDEKYVGDFFSDVFSIEKHLVDCVPTLTEGRQAVLSGDYDVIFLDVRLPDGNGLELLAEIRKLHNPPEIIIVTGFGDPDGAELAINNDAWDYIEKSSPPNKVLLSLNRALQFRASKKSHNPLDKLKKERIIGSSPKMEACFKKLAQAAGTDGNVLLTGETGTGKELFAHAIHLNSGRSRNPFVVVDCGALPETLTESVLFGHEKGAYTGADRARAGLVKMADSGTLFLDEVGELSLSIQKSFLRVLETRSCRPIGGSSEIKSDFRLIAATHQNLDSLVEKGAFRKDLLYRLRSITINIPPLRDHKEDIKDLAIYHMNAICARQKCPNKEVDPDFIEALNCHNWPGNIRELVNVMEETFSLAGDAPVVLPWHLPKYLRVKAIRSQVGPHSEQTNGPVWESGSKSIPTWREFKESNELWYLKNLMASTNWNITRASEVSEIVRTRIYDLLKKHGLTRDGNEPDIAGEPEEHTPSDN